MATFGIGAESTAGTRGAPLFGLENINKASINPGQAFNDDRKMHGAPYAHNVEKSTDRKTPSFAPECTFNQPNIGFLIMLLCQQVLESGAGPFLQTLQFPTSGRAIAIGDVAGVQSRTATVVARYGQTGNRDVAGLGGVISELSMTFGEGRVKPTANFQFLTFANNDAGTGTFTLPTTDIRGRDSIFKLGDGTPVALHSDEVALTIRALVTPHWYGGINAGNPFRLVLSDWGGEVTFSKPLAAAVDSLQKAHMVDGGAIANDMRMYLYDRAMADYNSALVAGNWRFSLNVSCDEILTQLNDETVDQVTASLRHDGTNVPFLYEQSTAATQFWAT
jgi:hypothetical protein